MVVAGCGARAPNTPPTSGVHPPRLASGEEVDASAIDRALDREVGEGESPEMRNGESSREIRSCRAWTAARAAGYEAIHPAGVGADFVGEWMARCRTLEILRKATPVADGHSSHVTVDSPFDRLLPASVALPPYEPVALGPVAGPAWADAQKLSIRKLSATTVQLDAAGWFSILELRAFADIDGDGDEDVVLSRLSSNKPVGMDVVVELFGLAVGPDGKARIVSYDRAE